MTSDPAAMIDLARLRRAIEGLEEFDRAVNGFLDRPPEFIGRTALDGIKSTWAENGFRGATISFRLPLEVDSTEIKSHAALDPKAPGVTECRVGLPPRASPNGTVEGSLALYTDEGASGAGADLILRLFADRIAVTLAMGALVRDLTERSEQERTTQNMFHELNHQITTPLKVALDSVEAIRKKAHPLSEFDLIGMAEDAASNMRRVHRISRRTDLFQALHLGKPLPQRGKKRLSGLVVDEIVRIALRDAQLISEVDAQLPQLWRNAKSDDLTGPWHATEVDPDILDQLLFNILENALKYSAPDTRIEVLIGKTSSGRPFIRVTNQGEAITMPTRKLVQRGTRDPAVFFRISEGAGLGLWIVDQVMTRLGGDLVIEPARGSEKRHRFTLVFSKGA